jgi:G3E family GTPase
MSYKKIPTTVVSGFLGAGKTTLVNHLLQQHPNENIGIVVNEFGEVGIDGELILADEHAIIEIRNGCICCTVRSDLVLGVKELLARSDRPIDRLIIETSGMADPAPVLQTFLADADLLTRLELESVVTVVDAVHIAAQRENEIVREQIVFADVLVLNKIDLLTAAQVEVVHRELRSINPTAKIFESERSLLEPGAVLGVRRFSLFNLLEIEPGILEEEHDHEHDESISSVAVIIDTPLNPARFNTWVNRLVQAQGTQLLRMKAVLCFQGEARRFYFHSVHMLLDSQPGLRWRNDEEKSSRIVFIGRDLDPAQLRTGFSACAETISPTSQLEGLSA